jgi:hypothetical protein
MPDLNSVFVQPREANDEGQRTTFGIRDARDDQIGGELSGCTPAVFTSKGAGVDLAGSQSQKK